MKYMEDIYNGKYKKELESGCFSVFVNDDDIDENAIYVDCILAVRIHGIKHILLGEE
jgi:hypothetical protein